MMHKLSIAFACVAGAFVSQASLADDFARFCLARASTSAEQFQQDRDACIAKATAMAWTSCEPKVDYNDDGTVNIHSWCPTVRYYKRSAPDFLQCMLAKGYQERPMACSFASRT